MRNGFRYLAAGLLLSLATALWAADKIEVIVLRHQTAESLAPALRPLLAPGGAVSGQGSTLIVRSTPDNIEQLKSVIQKLDVPRRQFLITVRQAHDNRTSQYGGSIDGDFGDGRTRVIIGSSSSERRIRVYGTDKREEANEGQTLRVMEGNWATISTGQSIPVVSQTTTSGPGGSQTQQSVEYKNVDTGFEVKPRMTGDDNVVLEVRPFRARPSSGGVIKQSQLSTTVSGQLGQWITLGGIGEQSTGSETGVIYGTKSRRDSDRRVEIRVDLIN